MLIDLMTQKQDASASSDVVIIGAGVAGLTLAARLRRWGLRSVVLEQSGRLRDEVPFSEADQSCGALPCIAENFGDRLHLGLSAWPLDHTTVMNGLVDVESAFKLDASSYEEDFAASIADPASAPAGSSDFLVRFTKTPTRKTGCLSAFLDHGVARDPGLAIWLNATATRFHLNRETGRLKSVTARSRDGGRLTVEARQFVICAGAFESIRLLLSLDWQHQDRPFRSCYALGRYLHDQAVCPIASVTAADDAQRERLNRLAAPRYARSTLRRLSFELSHAAQKVDGVTSALGYIAADASPFKTGGAPWKALRLFQSSEGEGAAGFWPDLLRDLQARGRAAVWRHKHRQVYWPETSEYRLFAVVEQEPQSAHRVGLTSGRDAFGAPMAEIKWRRDQSIARTITAFFRRFESYWSRQGLDAIARLELASDATRTTFENWPKTVGRDAANSGAEAMEVRYPSGGVRMGTNGVDAVVDKDLRTFAIPNLSVAGRAVFPSSACGDPTLMLMLLSLRLADRLAGRISPQSP